MRRGWTTCLVAAALVLASCSDDDTADDPVTTDGTDAAGTTATASATSAPTDTAVVDTTAVETTAVATVDTVDTTAPDGTTPATTTPDGSAALREEECAGKLPQGAAVTCGFVSVPENHDDPSGKQIEIAVATISAKEPSDTPSPPVVLLGGGPGEHVLAGLPSLADPASPSASLYAARDLILVDQRGVGTSRPALDCPDVTEQLAQSAGGAESVRLAVEGFSACDDELRDAGIDLDAYDTESNARDIGLVADALGHDAVHLFGTSYGTRLALTVSDLFPERVESLVLSSPVPLEENFVADAGRSYTDAVEALAADCAADTACNSTYTDLSRQLSTTIEQLNATPLEVTTRDPASGEQVTVPLNGEAAAVLIFTVFYLPGGPLIVPQIITSLADGDASGLLSLSGQFGQQIAISQGMQIAFLCQEEASEAEPPGPLDSPIGEALAATSPVTGRPLWDICADWQLESEADTAFSAATPEVPTLVVTGQLDQITPPAYGEQLANELPQATLVEVPRAGHSPLLNAGPCGFRVLNAFLDDPATVDVKCLEKVSPYPTPEEAQEVLTEGGG